MRILEIKAEKIIIRTDVIIVIFSVDFGIYGKGGNRCRYNGTLSSNPIWLCLYNDVGIWLGFLLPCLIGIIAAILFFIERDCDTSKNLRTIPVTNTQLIMAKISMLFIFSITFCLISTLSVALFCKLFHVGMVYGMAYKIFMSLIFGVLIVAASLPIVFLIIYFNQSFLLSILLAFFYSIFNWGILGTIGTSISDAKIAFLNSFPVICVMNWTSGSMMNHCKRIIFCRKPMRLCQLLSIQFLSW